MSKSWKYKRSRKSWDVQTLKLRIQDALEAIEPVFLGEEGEDYDRQQMELKLKAAHAYSQLASKHRKILELEDLQNEVDELKKLVNQRNGVH